jgi:hypothetical protein
MIGQPDGAGKLFIPEDALREFWMDGKPPLNAAGRWCPQIVGLKRGHGLKFEVKA